MRPFQKETTIFDRRLSFLFVLSSFLFSFFSLLSNCRFQRKDNREERKEKVALLRKALNYDFDCLHFRNKKDIQAASLVYHHDAVVDIIGPFGAVSPCGLMIYKATP